MPNFAWAGHIRPLDPLLPPAAVAPLLEGGRGMYKGHLYSGDTGKGGDALSKGHISGILTLAFLVGWTPGRQFLGNLAASEPVQFDDSIKVEET